MHFEVFDKRRVFREQCEEICHKPTEKPEVRKDTCEPRFTAMTAFQHFDSRVAFQEGVAVHEANAMQFFQEGKGEIRVIEGLLNAFAILFWDMVPVEVKQVDFSEIGADFWKSLHKFYYEIGIMTYGELSVFQK